jgi:hypothetical protein
MTPFPPGLTTDGPDFLSSTKEDAKLPLTVDLKMGESAMGSDGMVDGQETWIADWRGLPCGHAISGGSRIQVREVVSSKMKGAMSALPISREILDRQCTHAVPMHLSSLRRHIICVAHLHPSFHT